MLCLGATYHVSGKGGDRRVAAREFYQGAYFTALEPGEILSAIRIPVPVAGHGHAYQKLKRKIGDYATAAAAVVLALKGGGEVANCSIRCGPRTPRTSSSARGSTPRPSSKRSRPRKRSPPPHPTSAAPRNTAPRWRA
jgi:xanthine dehydrogenase iron-sulfur cluster and FAD-binding subunit A